MSLVRSKELFLERAFPLKVNSVVDRALLQPDLHRHEYFEMLYVERGALINRFKTGDERMKTGDLIIMKPYVLHVLEYAEGKRPVKAYCCSFLPQAVDGEIRSLEEVDTSHSPNRYFFQSFLGLVHDDVSAVKLKMPTHRRQEIAELFNTLRRLTRERTDPSLAWSRCTFLRLLALLADENSTLDTAPRAATGSVISASRYQAGLRTVLSHMHDHYQQPLKLKDVAAMSGSSVTYFCRLFKRETGMTFLAYLNSLRIERACVLLRDTTQNAMSICYQVGFNDYSHFSRQFKKLKGTSVTQYRIHHEKSQTPGKSLRPTD